MYLGIKQEKNLDMELEEQLMVKVIRMRIFKELV